MPLTPKGDDILAAMRKQYGAKKGTSVFYASRNKGTISGVEAVVHEQEKRARQRAEYDAAKGK